ncbi:MAG: hypothetical protein PVI99_05845, partial [Anaerolineales bacterium]
MKVGELPGTKILFFFLQCIAAVIVLSGCTSGQDPSSGSPTLALDMVVLLTPTPPDSASPTIEAHQDAPAVVEGCPHPYEVSLKSRPDYKLAASLIADLNNLSASQLVIYPNTGTIGLEQIFFVIEPNLMPGVFQLREVFVGGVETGNYQLEGNQLSIPLQAPLPPGCSVQISFTYNLALPEQAGIFG